MTEPALPWQELMEFGLGEQGYSSDQFWAMSLREINAALRGKRQLGSSARPGAPSGKDLAHMIQTYPDEPMETSMETSNGNR